MTKNIATADTAVKLVLAAATITFYFTNVITGPFAKFLMILSVIMLIIFGLKFLVKKSP